ncbi:hypothetical protein BX661DRAFT_171591 [Kickxella alabastrina]|uniref:uncharacterized protein n=1 Tax=Kickxella alabastrina TaxID=61397 RepID=UPI002220C1E7|nr:uncharacterized protein BX661DRAFT_171591 [Kickxella alabastrina]KAI7826311.1 hypothetical protein BX661DRAFT_171591 [Kickxella alabastrina]
MKLTTALVTIAALVSVGVNAQACSSNVVRKEIRSHTTAEWARVTKVVKLLQDSGWFTWFAYIHTANFGTIHGCEIFLPFHRRFLRDFESVGQMYDKQFALPYWDELRDYANPATSTVLSSSYLGGNGQGGDSCVANGIQANWSMGYPNKHACISAWYSPEFIQSLMSRSTKMSELRPSFEYSLHGSVHLALGGDMIMDWSPNDFAFWVHHANIDRLWFVWQMQNPNQNFWSIEGVDIKGKALTYGTLLPNYNENILSTMQPGYNNMCFFYDNGSTVSRKRSLHNKRDQRKCLHRPSTQMPPLVEGVFENVDDVPVAADTYVKDTIVASLPKDVLNKWFPTYTVIPALATTTPSITDDEYLSDVDSSLPEYLSSQEESEYSAIPIPTDESEVSSVQESAVYSEAYVAFDYEENPDIYGIDGVGIKYPMPNPFPLTPQWVAMHNLSPEVIHENYQQAKDFVRDMNVAGYQSPFAKGGQDKSRKILSV